MAKLGENVERAILTPHRIKAWREVTNQLLEDRFARVEERLGEGPLDFLRDACTYELIAHVYESAPDRLQFTAKPVYPTWRHQLVAELPYGSIRRRFLAFLWGIDPGYNGLVVDVERLALHPKPEAPVPRAGPLVLYWRETEEEEPWDSDVWS